MIPSHGTAQMKRTLFGGYLFKYCSVKYQTFHQVPEKTSQQTYSHQKTTWKAFQMPPRAIKHQLTCLIELTSGSFLIGRRGILAIPRNHLETSTQNIGLLQLPIPIVEFVCLLWVSGFLAGFFVSGVWGGGGGDESIVMQMSIVMLIFLLFSDKILGGAPPVDKSHL